MANNVSTEQNSSAENGQTNSHPHLRRGFTDEDRARSLATRRRKREERRLTSIDLIHKAVIEKADAILAPYWKAMAEGDWRASADLLNRVYGKPGAEKPSEDSVGVQELLRLRPDELHALRTHALDIIRESQQRQQDNSDPRRALPAGGDMASKDRETERERE